MGCSLRLTSGVLIAQLALGCDVVPYEIHEDKFGRQVRLNRWTGEIAVVQGETIIKLGRSVTYSGPMTQQWAVLNLAQLGDVTGTLRTAWHDGRLRYEFSLTPESKKLRDASTQGFGVGKSFTVLFTDSFGIAVVQDEVALPTMSRIVDNKGNPTGLSYNGQVACSYADYLLIGGWSVLWRL